ncbi:uncharacterized protein LOC107216612 isoform X1 [Neodiprion lecontei]|uniref:Uncharacterized protein LOC107216612 isoform X1 n=1 Tax=Neodiprion lecontei TaxID=441921 RepID=A0ABM3G281_NEOLC|nr:uncharacterized protein LOC107216612 isoform X1 [Neodiprion lecontei]XP_046594370.1 uncharacterized protein LOC107216612 isoform X1 [Neodiprion lecontei]
MKFGLKHLKPEDLNYFIQFGVSIQTLRSHKLWNELTDESLATSLRTMGFDDNASRKIILNGMLVQSEICLMQLMLAGVDVPGILNWQGEKIDVGARMIKFLRNLGIPEDVLQLIVQKGIDEETMEMLKDLGYTETEEEEHVGMHEVLICECDLTVLESEICSVNSPPSNTNSLKSLIPKPDNSEADFEAEDTRVCFSDISSSTVSNSTSSQQTLVDCKNVHVKPKALTSSELLTERNEYLRRTVMAPLAWAMSRALQYRPSDPNHYIACQLLRWRYGNVSKLEMKAVEDFVIARTIEMDKKLMEQKRKEEEELMAKHNFEALQNIPCHPCWQNQQIYRVKERCWKCIKKWVPNYERCELPEICSSCEVDLSEILNSDTATSSTGDNPETESAVQTQKVAILDNRNISSDGQYRYTENLDLSSYNRVDELYGEYFKSDSYEENMHIISTKSEA